MLKNFKKWLFRQGLCFTLGFLDNYKEKRSTPDDVVDALKIVTNFLKTKY